MGTSGGLESHLLGRRRQQPGLPFRLRGQADGSPLRVKVEQRPELAEPVERVQAQRVLFPAFRECGRDLAVSGPVDLLDPGAEPAGHGVPFPVSEPPPPRRGDRLVAGLRVIAARSRRLGEALGELFDLAVEP